MTTGLFGKVVIVTGGAQGIGKSSAETMASQGAKVVISDLNIKAAQETAKAICDAGGDAIALGVDVADETSVKEMVRDVMDAYGRIDVLYNNAAALGMEMQNNDRDVMSMSVDIWDKAMAINLRGPMLCSKYVLPIMIDQKSGSIIFASSGMGAQGEITRSAYAASKAGVMMLSKSIAAQYGKKGVRSNAVQIGYLPPVNASKGTPQEVQDILCSHNLVPHHLTPQHIADVIAFLASDHSAAITGHTLVADGGFSSHTPSMNDMSVFVEKIGQNRM